MNFFKSQRKIIGIILFIITVIVMSFFDMTLSIGFMLIAFLTIITFLTLFKIGIKNKTLYWLLLITFLVHLSAVLFIHYANFQPFSGGFGDYHIYDSVAKQIAERINQGNFSLSGLWTGHYYPVIIGYLYALTLPEMFMGQLLNVWLALISVLFVYLIVIEISGSRKKAFFIGLITCLYPSYLFFGSLLLKDVLVVPLVLISLLLILKLTKNFLWKNFLFFYIALGAVIHFRFYVGYALLFTFIPCWILLCKLNLKKKIIIGITMIVLLGFLPQFFNHGYYGSKTMYYFMNPKIVVSYREATYASSPDLIDETSGISSSGTSSPETSYPETSSPETFIDKLILIIFPNIKKEPSMSSSTVKVKTEIDNIYSFSINCSKSFIYVLLGPLPSQIQSQKHLFVLLETIPWYFLLFFIIRGSFIAFKRCVTFVDFWHNLVRSLGFVYT